MDASELARWRESVAERAFSEEFAFERDEGIVWVVVELRHSKRGRCCVGVVDWTGFRERFVTAYRTSAEVVSALKDIGFVSEHDYRSRCDL